jgi:cytochrome c-type biogenesis protein CcmF
VDRVHAALRARRLAVPGIGILLGARWSYAELGWGGYWAWDPVENASLLPWLTGTAFIHSIMLQEKRGMLKVWNASLILATGTLCVLGTFLVRSGILTRSTPSGPRRSASRSSC